MTYSLQFTERMTGAFGFAEADYQVGYQTGQKTGNRLLFRLAIATDDVDSFLFQKIQRIVKTLLHSKQT
jgi:hypothetical protein